MTKSGVQKGLFLEVSNHLLGVTQLNLEYLVNVWNSALGMRQVSLCGQQWCFTVSQPVCFAVTGVGGGFWCKALLEGSQAPRMLSSPPSPSVLGFVLFWAWCQVCPTRSISPLALSEEQVNAEVFTAPSLAMIVNQMSQARQEIKKLLGSDMLSCVLPAKF